VAAHEHTVAQNKHALQQAVEYKMQQRDGILSHINRIKAMVLKLNYFG
jgi:hypothetical protein